MSASVRVSALSKTFVLHNQGGVRLPVLSGVDFEVASGECVALEGPSGSGKSTLLKCIYGTYRASGGSIVVEADGQRVEVVGASDRELLRLRRGTLGYVSQFLRVLPRVAALELVAECAREPLDGAAIGADEARFVSEQLLLRLRIPMRLWSVPPATFSGGEQQRINIARGLVRRPAVLLLDEPTASLDDDNRNTVIELIGEARRAGCAVIGIFHDRRARAALATRSVRLEARAPA